MNKAKLIERKVLVDKFKKVVLEKLLLSDGSTLDWIYLDTKDSVMIVPITSDNKLVLVRQYRYNLKKFVFELPAGIRDIGKPLLEEAKQELKEETGYESEEIEYLGKYYCLPSECNRWLHVFLALNAKKVSEPKPDNLIEKYFHMSVVLKDFSEVIEQFGSKSSLIEGVESGFALELARNRLNS